MAMNIQQFRKQQFKVRSVASLPIALYFGFALSGIKTGHIDLHHLYQSYFWCLLHPKEIWFEKSPVFILLGLLIWGIIVAEAWIKLSYNLMHGEEYGSAKWGDIFKFNQKYAASMEEIEETELAKLPANASNKEKKEVVKQLKKRDNIHLQNKVLSENIRFRYKSDTLRNNNIFVVGGSGAGKTSFFLTPNLLSLHDCNIYTDPKGSLVEEFGAWLEKQPDTRVFTLNMCEMEKSMRFNPFNYIRKKSDITKLVSNLMQNTESDKTASASQDPFWPKAEKMFLEALFLYVWMECPKGTFDMKTGKYGKLDRNWRTLLVLLDEAQFGEDKEPPKLDARMERLASKDPDHPALKAYKRYRSGPNDTVRSVIMTVNARMQPFDNEELLDVFSDDEIPLDEFGVGVDGDGKTKSNLFIVIPDDDDTYNFVPGMVYTLMFQELYRQARFFGGKLPMDVGIWADEFANIKMPSNFEKILATCRSRGVYCVEILQSLAQIKTLFADGAWEGVIGNNDTFVYLGGNEASTFEYISKLLGKWTIDKRTNGESKGSNGSYSENYDVLGRELMMEYEIRLLPDDECIIFVRGEEPIRDKKWFPWEHKIYEEAKSCGEYKVIHKSDVDEMDGMGQDEDNCTFINEESVDYLKMQADKGDGVKVYQMDVYDLMMLDLDQVADMMHANDSKSKVTPHIDASAIQSALGKERERMENEKLERFIKAYDSMDLMDVYSSGMMSKTRLAVIREMLGHKVPENEIKKIVHPGRTDDEVMERRKSWLEMHGMWKENN